MGKKVEFSSKVGINAVNRGVLALRQPKSNRKFCADKGAPTRHRNLVEVASGQLLRHKSRNNMVDDVSEDLSDIDDAEVIGYLHNKKEMHFKKIIWEVMNKEYLKGRQQKRASKVKKATPAKKATKTASKMENEKRLSSKINYDVLKKLIDEPEEVPEKAKGTGFNSNGDSYGDAQQTNEKSSFEAHSFGESDEFEHENEYSEEIDASGDHYGDMYLENEEEGYSYGEDCDYEEY